LNQNISIDPGIQGVIRPLAPEEYKQLEQNILRDGVREPLSIWRHEGRDILLDGHNRHSICTKHNLPYQTVTVETVTVGGEKQPLDSVGRARIWVAVNQRGRRNMDTNDWAALVAATVPDFTEETKRRQTETLKANAPTGGQAKADKAKGLPLGKKLPKGTDDYSTRAVEQAIAQVAPQQTNRTYVRAVLKEAGYDAKKNTFKEPEKVTRVGSAPGQTSALELVKKHRNDATAAKLSTITSENANKLPTDKRYSVLYVDCPWQYEFVQSDNRKIENHYPTMDVDALCSFQVEFEDGNKKSVHDLAADDAVMFFWATAPQLPEALKVLQAWGFKYKSHFVWDKEKVGMGYWARGQHELLLVATKGKISPPEESARVASVIRVPRGKHSAKPELVYGLIEKMYPSASYLEIFSRGKRSGWDAVGNQIAN
jgi:N6-adenosine-specific RNA methylase IME4